MFPALKLESEGEQRLHPRTNYVRHQVVDIVLRGVISGVERRRSKFILRGRNFSLTGRGMKLRPEARGS